MLNNKINYGETIATKNTSLFEPMINWMNMRLGKVSYSMSNRYGPNSYDCSSALYFALAEACFLNQGAMGNTDSLFFDLERNGWQALSNLESNYKLGDIFIWGVRGSSGGALGHCGIFINENEVIHCNYSNNGISINHYLEYWIDKGSPSMTVYRFTGEEPPFVHLNYVLTSQSGTFTPNRKLPVCAEPIHISTALAYYDIGMQIHYDSFTIHDEFVWISYIGGSGNRRFVAVGPYDNNSDNIWGTGFEKPIKVDNFNLIYVNGTFVPNKPLSVCAIPTKNSPELAKYLEGMHIYYDSYTLYDGFVWLSYIADSGNRRFVAIGFDNEHKEVWGVGFNY